MAHKRCSRCRGTKSVITLGGLHKNCKVCNGIGYEEIADDKDVDNFLSEKKVENIVKVERKKPGRKKKVA